MKTLFTIRIDNRKLEKRVRKGTVGERGLGSVAFKDRKKYNRKQKHRRDERN